MNGYTIREKKNPLAIHGQFDSLERAERHLAVNIPNYCARGYYADKTLQPTDFYIHKEPKP